MTKHNLDPLQVIERAEHLVRYQGATWKRGRPGSTEGRPVIPLLAAEYKCSERWIRDCLRRGKVRRRALAPRSAPMALSQGMAKAYAAVTPSRVGHTAPMAPPQALTQQHAAPANMSALPAATALSPVVNGSVDGDLRSALRRYVAHSPTRTRETIALVIELLERVPKG